MKYRSRSDIVGLILDAANGGGATKTKLMHKAYLSFNQLREYLELLVENSIRLLQIQNTMDVIAPISLSKNNKQHQTTSWASGLQ
ncbi:MAG: winged helix-turn-helix domain-containing protein [Thermoproteota archaeon]|nr:winged helix-turn-helix domain-containing protein [Thermoproteota archaeon]